MNIIEKLKALGVDVTENVQQALAGDWVSVQELEKAKAKVTKLEADLADKEDKIAKLTESANSASTSRKDLEAQISELNKTIENERNARAAQDEETRLTNQVNAFLADKHFVNTITKDAIANRLVAELKKDTAKGRSVSEMFEDMTTDKDGNEIPGIIVDDKTFEASKKRASIVSRSINGANSYSGVTKEQFLRMNYSQRMELKAKSPEIYESLRKG